MKSNLKFKALLVENDLNYSKCCRLLGVTMPTFDRMVNDPKHFRLGQVQILSDACNVSLGELVKILEA